MSQKDIRDLLALVRKGLGRKSVYVHVFDSINWNNIIELAKRQTVLGVVAEAALTVYERCQPTQEDKSKLSKYSFSNVKTHLLINRALQNVFSDLQQEGIPAVLLKGQSLCELYPSPYMRQCGDIDLYVNPDNFDRAFDLAKRRWISSSEEHQSNLKHYHFSLKGIRIDLHHTAAVRFVPWKRKYFKQWMHAQLAVEKCNRTNVMGTEVLVPSATFNAFFLFYHAWYHFIDAQGVGIRQLCDWSLWLEKRKNEVDKKELKEILECLGLMKSWQIMGMACVEYLGLDKDDLPFYNQHRKKDAERLMNLILEEGNFGQYAKGLKESRKSKWRKLLWVSRRSVKIFTLAPMQTGCRYFSMLSNGLKGIVKR